MTPPRTFARPLAARMSGLPTPPPLTSDEPNIPAHVVHAAIDALRRGETHYTDRPGVPELRTWVTQDLKGRYGFELKPDQVTITCGATEARFLTVRLLAKAATHIVCPGDPTPILGAAHLAEASVVSAVDDPARVSLLYLTPGDDGGALLDAAASQSWIVLWDESSGAGETHPAQRPELYPRTITIGSVDATMPGWRVGWMAGAPQVGPLRAFKQSLTICATAVSQWAALEWVSGS